MVRCDNINYTTNSGILYLVADVRRWYPCASSTKIVVNKNEFDAGISSSLHQSLHELLTCLSCRCEDLKHPKRQFFSFCAFTESLLEWNVSISPSSLVHSYKASVHETCIIFNCACNCMFSQASSRYWWRTESGMTWATQNSSHTFTNKYRINSESKPPAGCMYDNIQYRINFTDCYSS